MNIVAIDLSLTSTGIALFKDGILETSEIHLICGRKQREGECNVLQLTFSSDKYLKEHKKNTKSAYDELVTRYCELSNVIDGVVCDLDKKYKVDLVVFEGLSFGSRGSCLFDLGKATGIVQYNLFANGFKFDTIPPTVVKKLIVGKGNAPKSMVAMRVFKLLGLDLSIYGQEAEDMYDAIAVGLAYYKQNKVVN